ncbi:MAG: ABC transporter permease [Sphingomonadales bacterium]|nr:ABC transporter permease [Sphingomonadales bacterium]MBD3774639.1 ABC transporter permease [Paracoccaceae bacterium]
MGRLKAITIKEFWALLRDPKGRMALFIPPLMQMFLFSFAATLEVRNVDIGLLDMSQGAYSQELVEQLSGSSNFRQIEVFHSPAELQQAIEQQQVIAAIVIEQDFDRRLTAGRPADIGVVLDGRRSNAAQIVAGYIMRIASGIGADVRSLDPPETVRVINWFNPNLTYVWYNLPSLIVMLGAITSIAVTSQSVSREREIGSFDQLMVSPLRVHEILLGKMLPPLGVSLFNGLLFWVAAQVIFGVPFTGSFPLFFAALLLYNVALIGVGMFISSLSQTQQQAFLGSFLVSVPIIMLSGFSSPVENMPEWFQLIDHVNPAMYFLPVSQGIFLKAMPASAVFDWMWPVAIIALVTLSAAAWLFRARME